jgi:hypothetical protein
MVSSRLAGISTNYTEVTWSGADTKGKSIIESSTNLTLSLSFHGIGAAAGKTFKRGRHERNAYENHEINFLTSIMDAKKNQILLYCPSRLSSVACFKGISFAASGLDLDGLYGQRRCVTMDDIEENPVRNH